MQDIPSDSAAGLGSLSQLPPEVRDKIYGFVLYFDKPRKIYRGEMYDSEIDSDDMKWASDLSRRQVTCLVDTTNNRAALLRASCLIYQEAYVAMFRVNEFTIWIDRDAHDDFPENISVEGIEGFKMAMGHTRLATHLRRGFTGRSGVGNDMPIPFDMLPHMQLLFVSVGSFVGVEEEDIVLPPREVSGPERPEYHTLPQMIDMLCNRILKRCHLLRQLRLSIRSIEETPQSMNELLKPFLSLRGVKEFKPTCMSMRENEGYKMWVDWNLKASYSLYMKDVMALPAGAPTPVYHPKPSDKGKDKYFDTVGAVWMGGTEFWYPRDHDDEDEDFDDDDYDFYDDDDGDDFLDFHFGHFHLTNSDNDGYGSDLTAASLD